MVNRSDESNAVSANNPCPFLRALVSMGKLSDGRESLAKVATVVAATALAGDGRPVLPRPAVFAIGSVANGLSPLSLFNTQWRGLQLNALRGGPLDKKGARSGLLDAGVPSTRGRCRVGLRWRLVDERDRQNQRADPVLGWRQHRWSECSARIDAWRGAP
jgi:hypothetical protein